MIKSKYIILDYEGCELPVIFSPIIDHKAIAGEKKVISAGFCSRNDDGTFSTWGKSVTLGDLGTRPDDAEILQKNIEFNI